MADLRNRKQELDYHGLQLLYFGSINSLTVRNDKLIEMIESLENSFNPASNEEQNELNVYRRILWGSIFTTIVETTEMLLRRMCKSYSPPGVTVKPLESIKKDKGFNLYYKFIEQNNLQVTKIRNWDLVFDIALLRNVITHNEPRLNNSKHQNKLLSSFKDNPYIVFTGDHLLIEFKSDFVGTTSYQLYDFLEDVHGILYPDVLNTSQRQFDKVVKILPDVSFDDGL
jgi:hypothetical protein